MIRTVENQFLKISVSDHGAELSSVYDKVHDREVLWQADPTYWKRHAPVLFPNVGRNYKDTWRLNGREFPSRQHGFARDSEFICTDITESSVTHILKASDSSRAIYPFDFTLKITHSLHENTINVCWEIENDSDDTMYFTIGAHPAFQVPVREGEAQSDYHLSFENQKSLTYILLDPATGTAIPDKTYDLVLKDGVCDIGAHMFDQDALVFGGGQIRKASLLFPDGSPYITVTCPGFPDFGIWSVPGSSFVCLEPWMGRCDDCGFEGQLSEKSNINALKPDEEFIKSYQITVH